MQRRWLEHALCELADRVAEKPGLAHHERIVHYHSHTGLASKDDETSWCSSFVCCAIECGAGLLSTKSAAARSWRSWGRPLERPLLGAIVVLWRVSPTSPSGHVGFLVGVRGDRVAILGGNQGNAATVQWFPKSRVLSYRWPDGVPG